MLRMMTHAHTRSWIVVRLVPVLFFALLTAVTARIALPLPFTPIPITLQVLAVLLSGLVLGSRSGALAQVTYLVALAAGLPISTAGLGGLAAFLSPTGGYLIAFPLGAWAAGRLVEHLPQAGRVGLLSAMAAGLCGVLVIYAGGFAWLTYLQGDPLTALRLGILPFIGADLVKALLAALAARGGRLLFLPLMQR